MKRLALGLWLGGTALFALAGAGGREPVPVPPAPVIGYSQLAPLKNAAFDRAFMGWAMSYLGASAEIANSASHSAKNAEVRAFAREVKAAHNAAFAKLQSWGGGAFGVFGLVGPRGDFDRWFLTSLPAQNRDLRQLLRLVPSHTRNVDLRRFAAQLLPVLDAEDARAQALLKTLP